MDFSVDPLQEEDLLKLPLAVKPRNKLKHGQIGKLLPLEPWSSSEGLRGNSKLRQACPRVPENVLEYILGKYF